jgi:hypothetical protein
MQYEIKLVKAYHWWDLAIYRRMNYLCIFTIFQSDKTAITKSKRFNEIFKASLLLQNLNSKYL